MRRRRHSSRGEVEGEETSSQIGNGSVKEKRREEGRMCNQIKVVKVSSLAWLCLGLIIGCTFGAPWTEDLMDLIRGYRWNRLDRCILETPEPHGYGVDFCRVPVDCEICSDVREIEEVHVSDLSVEMFEELYAYSHRPLVVRNASVFWDALQVIDYNWLKAEYMKKPEEMDKTGDECWFNRYKTNEFRNLRSVFKLPQERVKMQSGGPWYVGWSVCHEEVAEEMYKLIERPTFLHPESTPPKKPWIFIGTPGPGAHFHVDNVDLSSWQVQLRGVKTWKLRSPPECWMSCHGEIQTTLYPGDIIIVNTNIWFHSTKVHGPELSISMVNEFD